MQHAYVNKWGYLAASMLVYSAKKRAEIAPGVGKKTVMHFISRDGVALLHQGLFEALQKKVFPKYERSVRKLEERALKELNAEYMKFVEVAAANTPQPSNATTSSNSQT